MQKSRCAFLENILFKETCQEAVLNALYLPNVVLPCPLKPVIIVPLVHDMLGILLHGEIKKFGMVGFKCWKNIRHSVLIFT